MVTRFVTRPPGWFWVVAVLLVLWEAAGLWSWYQHWQFGPAAMGNAPTAYDVEYFAKLPRWYVWLFALATGTGLLGGILLLARKASARPVFVVSLIATVAMFAFTFLMTDLIAAKGVWTTYFPALIVALGLFSVWFAGQAERRGWLR